MTLEIRLEQSSLEHMTRQPAGLRYALFCDGVLRGIVDDCITQNTAGHIRDFEDFSGARADALTHPHTTLIRFYPDLNNRRPSQDFLDELKSVS